MKRLGYSHARIDEHRFQFRFGIEITRSFLFLGKQERLHAEYHDAQHHADLQRSQCNRPTNLS